MHATRPGRGFQNSNSNQTAHLLVRSFGVGSIRCCVRRRVLCAPLRAELFDTSHSVRQWSFRWMLQSVVRESFESRGEALCRCSRGQRSGPVPSIRTSRIVACKRWRTSAIRRCRSLGSTLADLLLCCSPTDSSRLRMLRVPHTHGLLTAIARSNLFVDHSRDDRYWARLQVAGGCIYRPVPFKRANQLLCLQSTKQCWAPSIAPIVRAVHRDLL